YGKLTFYNAMQNRLNELKHRELEAGVSLVGPHKHDIPLLLNGKDSRYYSSQGQQRTLILSFKVAQIMYHYGLRKSRPILLLDDVLSELDGEKRSNLLTYLED